MASPCIHSGLLSSWILSPVPRDTVVVTVHDISYSSPVVSSDEGLRMVPTFFNAQVPPLPYEYVLVCWVAFGLPIVPPEPSETSGRPVFAIPEAG